MEDTSIEKNDYQLLRERYELVTRVVQLMASGVEVDRLPKTLARECAFRFNADCALTMVLTETGEGLIISGAYGLEPSTIPRCIQLTNTILGRTLRVGGIASIMNLEKQQEDSVNFLVGNGISSLNCCLLDLRGERIGALLLGYKEPLELTEERTMLLEEYAQVAAVALSKAISQKRLTEYTEQLVGLVQERTADLAIQTVRAEEANLAKSRFVANMSHELRTPLTAIIGYASVINDGIYGPINDKQKEALQAICRSSELLKDLIDDVLNLSRIEAGKEQTEPSKIELSAMLNQIFKLMLQTAMAKKLKILPLQIDTSLKSAFLWIDPRHIRQILINLISNAIKYTQQGGQITIKAETLGDKIKISVTDTGVGIGPDLMKRLFTRFERGEDKYSSSQSGTGLGLALTKKLVELNGGVIGVESEVQKGSTFWVLIPMADSQAVITSPVENTPREKLPRLEGLNILIVEDNTTTSDMMAVVINEAEGNAFCVGTVQDAKRALHSSNYDVVLVDLALPKENGLILIDHVKNECEPPLNRIPMIVVSACVFDQDRQMALNHGAVQFITKPFHPEELLQAIRLHTTQAAINSTTSFKDE